MTEIMESRMLVEQVIGKHARFLETYNSELSELEGRLNAVRQQSDAVKKEIEATEIRVNVLNEKYHLVFHQAKKQREELFNHVFDKLRGKASAHDITRLSNSIAEHEKKLQTSKNIEDEERTIVEIKKLLYDFESAAKKEGIAVAGKGVVDKLNEANSSHKELISIQNKPEQVASSSKDYEKQTGELDGRCTWLKRRIESHNSALTYWEKQRGG